MADLPNFDISQDTIFVTGLPEDTTEEQIAEYFGQIGIIKFDKKNNCPKIWIYKDKATGKGKGEATITYDDPPTATSAISWFNGKEFRGAVLSIELAQRKSAPQFSRGGGGGGRGRGGAGRGDTRPGGYDNRGDRGPRDDRSRQSAGPGRPGDWLCPSCSNNNFAYRQECNRCRTQKPSGAGNEPSAGGAGGSYNNGGNSGSRYRDDNPRGSNFGSRGGANFRDNDMRSRDRNSDRDRYGGGSGGGGGGGGERDRDRYGNDRERNRGGYASGGHGGGPSRNYRGKDDRRSRPY